MPTAPRRPRPLLVSVVALGALGLVAPLASPVWGGGTRAFSGSGAPGSAAPRCPWVEASRHESASPAVLAAEVVPRMTLAEKASFVVLSAAGPYENESPGVPSLCIPPLTLQDGPNGLAYRLRSVTQLPASIGVAASFDTGLALDYGEVLGAEARGKGVDVVQGPNLNLARVPESGRIFEGYGEDPFLVSVMGDADIEGIQSTGTLADAKHFTAYNQETARSVLDQVVPARALEELYLVPFEAAVRDAHVASLMCAYGALDGTNTCSDAALYATLYRNWGFRGFVRSDLDAVKHPAVAFDAGMAMIKPASVRLIEAEVADHQLNVAALNLAVTRVLRTMFAYGLVGRPRPERPRADVATRSHAGFALRAAEETMVLLKNSGVLPLGPHESLAVIGEDAGHGAASAGHGSARVIAPFLSTPLRALSRWSRARVTSAAGGPNYGPLPPIPARDFVLGSPLGTPPGRRRHGGTEPGKSDISIVNAAGVTRAVATADAPGEHSPWSVWRATIVAPRSGLYDISLTESGDTWLSINGKTVIASPGLHGHYPWVVAVPLVKGEGYRFELRWFQAGPRLPELGWEDVTPAIDRAAAAARRATVAVVFVSDFNSEGLDRPSLELPGDANALVEAVARANRRTVVVLNTGGAVLMPWLGAVAGVLEAWYPGEEDGAATTAVLSGAVDPSGHLPITFPPSEAAVPASDPSQFPGVDETVTYSEGLDVGYRWYEAHGVRALFSFGFGLTYTSFALSRLQVRDGRRDDAVSVRVRNVGHREGSAVVQCYLEFPASAGEPPRQLRDFARVTIAPGRVAMVTMRLSRSDFEADLGGRFTVPAGTFTAWVGQSSASLPDHAKVLPPSAASPGGVG